MTCCSTPPAIDLTLGVGRRQNKHISQSCPNVPGCLIGRARRWDDPCRPALRTSAGSAQDPAGSVVDAFDCHKTTVYEVERRAFKTWSLPEWTGVGVDCTSTRTLEVDSACSHSVGGANNGRSTALSPDWVPRALLLCFEIELKHAPSAAAILLCALRNSPRKSTRGQEQNHSREAKQQTGVYQHRDNSWQPKRVPTGAELSVITEHDSVKVRNSKDYGIRLLQIRIT